MNRLRITIPAAFRAAYFTDYEDQSGDELVIPEDLGTLSDESLNELHDKAIEAFNLLYGEDGNVSNEVLGQLSELTEAIGLIGEEVVTRQTAATERSSKAAELAAKVRPAKAEEADSEDEADEEEDADEAATEDEPEADEPENDEVVASGRKPVRVNIPGLSGRRAAAAAVRTEKATTMQDLVHASPGLTGFASGAGMDWAALGRGVDARLHGFNPGAYANARRAGKSMSSRNGVATVTRPMPTNLIVDSMDPHDADEVIQRAINEKSLPGNSLVAAGGWCAPSETLYDLCELESAEGLLSIPEIGIKRGGIRWTLGPDWSEIFDNTGFYYTEDEDIAGDYDGLGGGSKPCYDVACPDPWDEARLGVSGLCITSGLLSARGYPEVLARTVRGALIAHAHKIDTAVINSLVAGSTKHNVAANQVGTAAPVLQAIEFYAEHIRYKNRMPRAATMEAVFPFWIHAAIRADLSRRLGINLLDVDNGTITRWFRARGINPQFVYNYQPQLSAATAYPGEVKFLMYPAGTWIKGVSDIITIDTMFDAQMLGTNDFTALFTEEGWLTAKLCFESHEITVPICPDGATAGGVAIACDGSEAV